MSRASPPAVRRAHADEAHSVAQPLHDFNREFDERTPPVAIWSSGLECYLAELYVVPGRRGHGLGRALMEAAAREARNHGADTMEIGVDEPDLTARDLYESLGFSTAAAAAKDRSCTCTNATSAARASTAISARSRHSPLHSSVERRYAQFVDRGSARWLVCLDGDAAGAVLLRLAACVFEGRLRRPPRLTAGPQRGARGVRPRAYRSGQALTMSA
jgi:hypothetical protein